MMDFATGVGLGAFGVIAVEAVAVIVAWLLARRTLEKMLGG